MCRPYGVGRRESQSWREAQEPPLRFQFPQRRSTASHKVLLRRVSCFAAKRGLIARERPRPASLGLRPIHLQKTLTVSLRAKCRRPAAVAFRCALRGYLSHYLSLRNLTVPQRRSEASHKVLLPTFLSRKVGQRSTAPQSCSRVSRMDFTSWSASSAVRLRSSARRVRLKATDFLPSGMLAPR